MTAPGGGGAGTGPGTGAGMGQRDRMFKVLVVGDATVGKTSLVQRYANDSFNRHYKSTVGGERGSEGGAGSRSRRVPVPVPVGLRTGGPAGAAVRFAKPSAGRGGPGRRFCSPLKSSGVLVGLKAPVELRHL